MGKRQKDVEMREERWDDQDMQVNSRVPRVAPPKTRFGEAPIMAVSSTQKRAEGPERPPPEHP